MAVDAPLCERCDRVMDQGYLIDHSYYVNYPAAWVPGAARWSRWSGLKIRSEDIMPVITWRCGECGRLTSFANPGKWPA